MKRLLSLMLVILLLLPALPASKSAADETTVRVLLSTDASSTVSVTLSGKYAVGDKTVTGGTVTASIENGVITVRHSSAGVLKTTDTVTRLKRVGTDASTILTFQNAKHGKRSYYGDFVFYNDGGTLRVINYVDLHHYLYGVVSGEMSDSSKPDLLKVETICAKGFALCEVETRASKYFDVYDTTNSQLYYGYVATDVNTIAAVDAVWQQTLRYNGSTVKTYYSTADGGQILTPYIHWGGKAQDGAYHFGYDPFDLLGSSKNVVRTIDGKAPKSMDAALYAFLLQKAGSDAKEIVSVDALTGIHDTAHPNGTDRYPNALAPQARYDWTVTVKKTDGSTKKTSFSCTPDEVKAAAASDAAGTVCFAVRTAESEWKLIWGVPSGHRTGLSHRGATQMVKQGYSYVDVLKFYYRGATLYDANGKAIESNKSFVFTYEEGATSSPAPTPGQTEMPTEIDHCGIVTVRSLDLRESPSDGSAVKRTLSLGAIVGIYGASGDWLYVRDEASRQKGYVSAKSVNYYERTPRAQWEGVCNADDSNLRSGPSTNFAKYYAISKGAALYVYYRSGDWYYVMDRATGQGAFLYGKYVTLGADAPTVRDGDANGSDSVTAADAALILRFLVKLSALKDAGLLAADVTHDGTVNAEDAAAILRQAAGLN